MQKTTAILSPDIMKFTKYFFGDIPEPSDTTSDIRKILNSHETDLVLTTVAKGNHIENNSLTSALADIGVLKYTENRIFRFACPIFLESDLQTLKKLTATHAEAIANKLLDHKAEFINAVKSLDSNFSPETHLYHMLCAAVFDGCFFDRLAAAGIVTVSKPQPNGGDYLPVIYQDSPGITAFSASLLCSYNRLSAPAGTFSSFGDANGARNDMYRWYVRLKQSDNMPNGISLSDLRNKLSESFSNTVKGIKPAPEFCEIFNRFGYMKGNITCVPIYTSSEKAEMVNKLDELTAELALREMIDALNNVASASELTSAIHGVPVPDIANEVYHLLFGQINEYLVRGGLAAAPEYRPGEGRYLRCFEIN